MWWPHCYIASAIGSNTMAKWHVEPAVDWGDRRCAANMEF
jgi:hypothetical protein